MLIHDASKTQFFTRSEAAALVGKSVRINSGAVLPVVGTSCCGRGRFCVTVPAMAGHTHEVHKSHRNGLYVTQVCE